MTTLCGDKNPMFGKHHTIEAIKKMSVVKLGTKLSDEHKKNISAALLKNPPMKGKHHTKISLEQMSVSHKGKQPRLGIRHTEETKEKIRVALKGDKCHLWRGGISYLPYCSKFNRILKEEIREKYGRKCFLCGKHESENNNKNMCVHHIDYDKEQGCNGKTFELVPLCRSCHSKTNGEREKYRIMIINKLRMTNDCN